MFGKSLDNKERYKLDDGTEVVDLTESIFDYKQSMTQICQLYKVSKEYEMRPDILSKVLYGTTDYTEMILKYSMISNPFSLCTGDLIFSASLEGIYNPVKDYKSEEDTKVFDAVKNYHKYIDKTKLPTKAASDVINTQISSSPSPTSTVPTSVGATSKEANITKKGETGITVKNGKIYFGAIDETITNVDSNIVDCATNGQTIGEFLNATLRNAQ